MSKKKRKTKITKAQRIERQIKLLYKSLAEHRETEWALADVADRVFEQLYELENILHGVYEEKTK
jgi:transcriptional regulator NrdR family protein